MVRNMKFNQRLLLSIALLAGFGLLVLTMLMSYIYVTNGLPAPPLVMLLFEYHFEIMILVSVLGIVVGASMYFLMHEQVEVKTKEAAGNAQMLLTFLSGEERTVVELLLKSEGHTTQAQASKLEGMTRLKAHRTVLRLADKKIIRIEKLGKTNQLWLAGSIYDALRNGGGKKAGEEKGGREEGKKKRTRVQEIEIPE